VGFGTSLLGLAGTTPLSFTITNPNQRVALTGIAFGDTLPSGLVAAGPTGSGNTCGGGSVGAAGSTSIALTGGQLAPAASCSLTVSIAATAIGLQTDETSPVNSNEGGAGNAGTAAITVVGAPRLTVSSPVGGRVYAFGQKVTARYSCVDDPNGPGIRACVGDAGNGALINTSKAGGQTFTVTAVSNDGGIASDTVFYRVAPDNRFTAGRIHVHRNGSIDFSLTVPGPGRVSVTEKIAGAQFVFATGSAVARRAGKLHLTIRATARGRRAVRQRAHLRVSGIVAYTPTGGKRRSAGFRFRIAA
jgi:hypothetical protein